LLITTLGGRLKRSLTPKVQPVSPCLADAFEVFATSPEQDLTLAKPALGESSRRVRRSAFLSLAALSMGATAGVLLPSHGDEAKATEPNLSQFPLPSEATGNPYQAIAQPEDRVRSQVTLPTAPLTEPAPSIIKPVAQTAELDPIATPKTLEVKSIPAIAQQQKGDSSSLSALNKKQIKVVSAQLNEQSQTLNPAFSTLESDTPQSTNTIESSAISPFESASQPAPTEVAKTPGFVDSNTDNKPVIIPVPAPETAAIPDRVEQPVIIPVPQPESVADRPAQEAIEVQPQELERNASEPQLLVPEVAAAGQEETYQVQPGDTIDAIALRHGVSRSDLVRANHLDNPHQIQIAQELKIPQPQSMRASGERNETVVPGFSIVPPGEANSAIAAPTPSKTPALRAENPDRVIVPTEPLVPANSNTAEQPVPASVAVSVTPNEELEQSNRPEENTVVEVSSNPYIERLKADILRMREEYRATRSTPAETPSSNTLVVDASPAQSANPEWQSNREQRPIQVETTANSLQVYTVQVRDNRGEVSKDTQSSQVAVAPVPVQEYNPSLRPQTGQQVSPDLPPLAPDRYLPESPAQFNGYIWPTTGVLTSGYGRRWGRMHRGIDVAGPTGTPIVAAAGGEVITAGWNSGGYGNLVDIRHSDGSMTRYAHNSKILVRKGQWVEQGERISLMGSTGYSTGPHLHFEVHPGGEGAVNPIAYLPAR
jgi:murein DD-endopeptidase MepM/ murein hydrolase activator NlpD